MRHNHSTLVATTVRLLRIVALCIPLSLMLHQGAAAADLHAPSVGAKGMPGAKGTFSFKPADWKGMGVTTWWSDTDGVNPGVAGCHLGMTAQGKPNGRTFGEACTEAGLLVESNPGVNVLHAHTDDTGHPDLFDCNQWCRGQSKTGGVCRAAAAPPCASSARCVCR